MTRSSVLTQKRYPVSLYEAVTLTPWMKTCVTIQMQASCSIFFSYHALQVSEVDKKVDRVVQTR